MIVDMIYDISWGIYDTYYIILDDITGTLYSNVFYYTVRI